MPLIISPKTTRPLIKIFCEVLKLKKVPINKTRFWHGNFMDSFYRRVFDFDGVSVMFVGYSGAVCGQAIFEYAEHYLKDDPYPGIYFVGSVLAFKHSELEPGDLCYAADTFSHDSFEHAIYLNAARKGVAHYTKPDALMVGNVLRAAKKLKLDIRPTKVFCRITPGLLPSFTKPKQLMDEAMWWHFALGIKQLQNFEFDSGEYESAAVLATARLLGIPAVALFDVKDKRTSRTDYRIVGLERKEQALREILAILKELTCFVDG